MPYVKGYENLKGENGQYIDILNQL